MSQYIVCQRQYITGWPTASSCVLQYANHRAFLAILTSIPLRSGRYIALTELLREHRQKSAMTEDSAFKCKAVLQIAKFANFALCTVTDDNGCLTTRVKVQGAMLVAKLVCPGCVHSSTACNSVYFGRAAAVRRPTKSCLLSFVFYPECTIIHKSWAILTFFKLLLYYQWVFII